MRRETFLLSAVRLCLLTALWVALNVSCAHHDDFKLGNEALKNKDWDQAVNYFLEAVAREPDNVKYRVSLANALIAASNLHLNNGRRRLEEGRLKPALVAFEKALEYNPENNLARKEKILLLNRLRELEKQQRQESRLQKLKDTALEDIPGKPILKYNEVPYSLKFSGSDLKKIFSVLQKTSGVTFIFDDSFKSKKVAVDLQDMGFTDVLEKLVLQSNLFYKVIDETTVMVIPDTPSKRREYEELVMKTVFLSNSDPESIAKMVRSLTGMKTIAIDENLKALTFKGRPELVKMAETIAAIHDKPLGEVFINIEIIEVNRSRVREYGIELSQYQVTESYLPDTGSESTTSTIRLNMLGSTDTSDYLLTLPSIHYKLLKTDRRSRIKARPQLRGLDGKKVEVSLGDKVPIPTTSFVPYNTGGPAQQPITSYKLEDIGINIKVTPQIHHDGLVTLEMEFELSFITNPGTERLPPTIGSRSVKTTIKLRDHETSILAGLLRDTERKTMRGFPFLSRVPILKEIFSGNKNEVEQTDIILTLTPRIIRFPEIDKKDLELFWVGTLDRPGLKPKPPGLEPDRESESTGVPGEPEPVKPGVPPPKTSPRKKPGPVEVYDKPNVKDESNPGDRGISIHMERGGEMVSGKSGDILVRLRGNRAIRAVILDLQFPPSSLRVLSVQKGALLTGAAVKSHLLKNIDNKRGRLKINLTMDQPLQPDGEDRLAAIRIKPEAAGSIALTPRGVRVLDEKMKEIETKCSGIRITIITPDNADKKREENKIKKSN